MALLFLSSFNAIGLLVESDQKVLAVALDAGFSFKSAVYMLVQKLTRCSLIVYRRLNARIDS